MRSSERSSQCEARVRFFVSSRRRHTRCALVTGVQTCALPISDARGKVIGHVQELRQTGRGVVETVTVEVGNRVATLPAASFTGSGDVLVTGMTKGQLKDTAEQQDARAGRR